MYPPINDYVSQKGKSSSSKPSKKGIFDDRSARVKLLPNP